MRAKFCRCSCMVVVDCHPSSWNALRQEGEKGRRKGVRVMMTSWKGGWLWPEDVTHPRSQHHSLPAVCASPPRCLPGCVVGVSGYDAPSLPPLPLRGTPFWHYGQCQSHHSQSQNLGVRGHYGSHLPDESAVYQSCHDHVDVRTDPGAEACNCQQTGIMSQQHGWHYELSSTCSLEN